MFEARVKPRIRRTPRVIVQLKDNLFLKEIPVGDGGYMHMDVEVAGINLVGDSDGNERRIYDFEVFKMEPVNVKTGNARINGNDDVRA